MVQYDSCVCSAGVDVTANQDEISSHETFQLEFDWGTRRWYIRTMQDRYWTLEAGGGIQASADSRSSNALFQLEWQGSGAVAFRANNGKYLTTKRSGHLYANADQPDDNCKYYFYLINRSVLLTPAPPPPTSQYTDRIAYRADAASAGPSWC